MFHTCAYTILKKDDTEIVIKPYTKFNNIPSGYTPSASAIIRDEDGKVVMILSPGKVTTDLGIPKKKVVKKTATVKK